MNFQYPLSPLLYPHFAKLGASLHVTGTYCCNRLFTLHDTHTYTRPRSHHLQPRGLVTSYKCGWLLLQTVPVPPSLLRPSPMACPLSGRRQPHTLNRRITHTTLNSAHPVNGHNSLFTVSYSQHKWQVPLCHSQDGGVLSSCSSHSRRITGIGLQGRGSVVTSPYIPFQHPQS